MSIEEKLDVYNINNFMLINNSLHQFMIAVKP